MELQDSISKVAKMVWIKLQYTECKIKGEDSTVIEIKDVWGLIKEIEDIIETQKKTIDFNVQQNINLIKENHRLNEKIKAIDKNGFPCKEELRKESKPLPLENEEGGIGRQENIDYID